MQDKRNIQINNQDSKSVIVLGDLSENVQFSDINIFLESFKDHIAYIDFKPKFDFSSKTGSAIVIFKDFNYANQARLELNMRKIKGKTVRITWHEKDLSLRYGNQCNLYVKNISPKVSPRQFFEFFLQFGDITSAKLAENEDGEHLGYGYIHYANPDTIDICVNACDDKEWYGQRIKVEPFQKKNERPSTLNQNNSLFVKNFPSDYDENKLKDLFYQLNISWIKINTDELNRKTAFVTFSSDDDAAKAKLMNGTSVGDQELFVSNLQNKFERKRYLSTKITEKNNQLANIFKECNLHVKNLPLEVKEEELREIFVKYGEIKSLKIKTQINSTKVKDKFIDTVVSCGYGYVCYTNPESAKLAFSSLNNQFLDGFTSKRPLEITYFTPVSERKNILVKNYYSQRNVIMDNFYSNQKQIQKNQQVNNQKQVIQQVIPQQQVLSTHQLTPQAIQVPAVQGQETIIQTSQGIIEPDYRLLNTFQDESEKRDYLGEFIFNKITVHELTERHKLSMEDVGKITGMILGIENFNEIVEISKNKDNLTSRIIEALELLSRSS
jgi:RNA recognition motif-containing protein